MKMISVSREMIFGKNEESAAPIILQSTLPIEISERLHPPLLVLQ